MRRSCYVVVTALRSVTSEVGIGCVRFGVKPEFCVEKRVWCVGIVVPYVEKLVFLLNRIRAFHVKGRTKILGDVHRRSLDCKVSIMTCCFLVRRVIRIRHRLLCGASCGGSVAVPVIRFGVRQKAFVIQRFPRRVIRLFGAVVISFEF